MKQYFTWPKCLPWIAAAALSAGVTAAQAKQPAVATAAADHPIVIGHRGAPGYRPEHTLASYWLAIRQGADFIEPDLVPTKDGHLIARHENELGGSTDVADHPEFTDRKTTKMIDGVAMTGWFSEDFTLAEIKTLRAKERIPEVRPRNTRFDGKFAIPTLEEIIGMVRLIEHNTGKKVGLYPETKHPTYFAKEGEFLGGGKINMSIGRKLIETLVSENFTDPTRVYIQSFEVENLMELQKDIMPSNNVDLPLVQLYGDFDDIYVQPDSNFSRPYDMYYNAKHGADMATIYGELNDLVEGGVSDTTGYGKLVTPQTVKFIADNYAEGVGPWKNSFLLRASLDEKQDTNGDGKAEVGSKLTGGVHPFLQEALANGLEIHPYTLRVEEQFLTLHPNNEPQTLTGEAIQMLGLGVSGFFTDNPDLGVRARDMFLKINEERPRHGNKK
ncbi:glycerophosphodiester phosphodiesterase family protein [Hahella aquimaris]|uniref:glycerophosphodiester phosphodiesterase family protein n=1 Tax=Hahella sp. HNIBRBA332 TaxID=3015983 RepID=UPI00273C82DC|nr:glycerophosphodiester phosphodiesterase family protein [Hahella sp. HNIBRBA332]WLQ11615.1 glycerophosphodiester phosphodiesterase family protein [Hahella sp. HNIBRBA332]